MDNEKFMCRHREEIDERGLPRNFVVAGFCGVDARKCEIKRVS